MKCNSKLSVGIILSILFILYLSSCGGGGGGGGGENVGGDENVGSTDDIILSSGIIGPSGGSIEVTDSSSPLYGIKVEVPSGALETDITITIYQVVTEPPIPDTAVKVSKIISFKPDGIVFKFPATITIPYDEANVSDENALQVYAYDDFSWEGVTFKDRNTETNTITALSWHFSDHVILEPINQGPVDTGFMVNRDGFKISNFINFSLTANCLGMASYAKWFFEERGCEKSTECNLYAAYDEFIASEIATAAQKAIDPALTDGELWLKYLHISDKDVASQLARTLESTHRPQILGVVELDKVLGEVRAAHAVLVYAYYYDNEGDQVFRIYDPNKAGIEKTIEFDGENFEDYFLGGNPLIAEVDYAVISSYQRWAMEKVYKQFPFPRIDSIGMEGDILVLKGWFGTGTQNQVEVMINENPCQILSWADSEIRCQTQYNILNGIKIHVVESRCYDDPNHETCSYIVYGGNVLADDSNISTIVQLPETYGFKYLGNATSTSAFYGSYMAYLVRLESYDPLNPLAPFIKIDAIELLNPSQFWKGTTDIEIVIRCGGLENNSMELSPGFYSSGLGPTYNVYGPPDGIYASRRYFFIPALGWE